MPFYYDMVNCVWVGLWCGIVFTTAMLVTIDYTMGAHAANVLAYREQLTIVSAGLAVAATMCKLSGATLAAFEVAKTVCDENRHCCP